MAAQPSATEKSDSTRLAIDGGSPVRRTPWPAYDKGAVFVCPEDEESGIRAIRSHLYFRYDFRPYDETECGRFEAQLCRYFGTKHALATSSGTTALTLAIMAARLPPGSLIACPGFTFVATPSAIVLAGCKPFLVEVDQDLHLDLADLARRWTPEIKAILVVHMRGFAADMEALTRFADQMGVPVIEDAVPALGAELNGRKLGTFGLAGAFSTQSDKSLNCGEGGFLVTNDSALFGRAVVLSGAYEGRYHRHFGDGQAPLATDLDLPLLGVRMDEIRAAMLSSEIERLPIRLTCFKTNYDYVAAALRDVAEIAIRRPVAPGAYLGEALIFRVPDGDAKWFARALCSEGIDARNLGSDEDDNVRVFWNWRFLFGAQPVAAIQALLPATAWYLREAVDVPLSSCLSAQDCDHLIAAVRKVAGAMRSGQGQPGARQPAQLSLRRGAMDTSSLKILCITGWCRNGSTIIGNVLGEVPGVFHVGELHFLWKNAAGEGANNRCGCGSELTSCPLWSQILPLGRPADLSAQDWADAVVRRQRACVRTRHTWRVLGRGLHNDQIREHAALMSQTYHAIAERTGARLIVDTTKIPGEAALLSHLGAVTPYYVHLVRDPRAVAQSWSQEKDYCYIMPAGQSTAYWHGFNTASRAIVRRYPDRSLFLRYEDFTTDPAGTIEALLRLCGADPAANPVQGRTIELHTNHTVTGNPDRFLAGSTLIRDTDDSWQAGLSTSAKLAVLALSWPQFRGYGYRYAGTFRSRLRGAGVAAAPMAGQR